MMIKLLITFENVQTDEGSYSKEVIIRDAWNGFFSATTVVKW